MEIKEFNIREFGACGDGVKEDTSAIQSAVDAAAKAGGKVIVPPGNYLTGSLFLKSGIEFHLEKEAVLLGIQDESAYPEVRSRVAGVEMEWPAGIINIFNGKNISVTGDGRIDGQGRMWWNRYWGEDKKGGMRKEYERQGLRWAVDYDCRRPRNVIVHESDHILLKDFKSEQSGFWNLHICYSSNVHIQGITIGENDGPSTDGIDLDSCSGVLVEQCRISCNDDSICIKSGRDADGLRVNRICENIEIRDCDLSEGSGVTLGSETSGGIRNVRIHNIRYNKTLFGFRIKSARTRGGLISDIQVENLVMKNVMEPFSWQLDWNPDYSYCRIPETYKGHIPERWNLLAKEVKPELGMPKVENIWVKNVRAEADRHMHPESSAFMIDGYEESPMKNICLEDISVEARRFGHIRDVDGLVMKGIEVKISAEWE